MDGANATGIEICPTPRQVDRAAGFYRPAGCVSVGISPSCDRRVAQALETAGSDLPGGVRMVDAAACDAADVAVSVSGNGPPGAYELRIDESGIRLDGADAAGVFYGVQSLRQLMATAEPQGLPAYRIVDRPALAVRGVLLDVSRGKMPKRATLLRVIDRLASLKINHLQLYVEHVFDFAFDPAIGAGCAPLTADDVRTLDAYCKARFIDFVPCIACLGHMGRILSLERYRALAEIPPARSWADQSWLERLRGLTLDPSRAESGDLLSSMLDEFLPAFSSELVNVNCDEPHDLGRGRPSPGPAGRTAKDAAAADLYAGHLEFLASLAERHGKRMMFWGDFARAHPNVLRRAPAEAIVIDWGYERDYGFGLLDDAAADGRCRLACAGTHGWGRLINDYDTARANIATAADRAAASESTGVIVADWGDYGHFNLLTVSWPMIVFFADRAWNAGRPNGLDDVAACRPKMIDLPDADCWKNLLALSEAFGDASTWCALHDTTRPDGNPGEALQGLSWAESAESIGQQAATIVEQLRRGASATTDTQEWVVAVRACGLLAEKGLLMRSSTNDAQRRQRAEAWADQCDAFRRDFARCWLERNRLERLGDIERALAGAARAVRGWFAEVE